MEKLPAARWQTRSQTSDNQSLRIATAKSGVAKMMDCYRATLAPQGPDTYIAAAVALLTRYPNHVIVAVTDPVTGIPSKMKWLPTLADIKEACDALMPSAEIAKMQKQAREQIAERETLALADGRPKKTYQQIVEETRAMGIPIGRDGGKTPTGDTLADFFTKYGVSPEQWESIPDAPRRP